MIMFKGTIQAGRVVLPQPANLPDGTAVTVVTHERANTLGIPDDEWPTDADGIARLVARMGQVEPFEMSADEEADLEAWRRKVKECTVATQSKTVEELFE